MADEERRRIRRRKILENAEERKRKIFGNNVKESLNKEERQSKSDIDQDKTKPPDKGNDVNHQDPLNDVYSSINNDILNQLSPSSSNETVSDSIDGAGLTGIPGGIRLENGLGSMPGLPQHFLNLNRELRANGNPNIGAPNIGRPQENVQTVVLSGPVSSPVVPVFLALLVSILLSLNLGYVVSHSIAIPFLLWEAQHIWCNRQAIQAVSRGSSGFLSLALMLCGVNQATVTSCLYVMTIVKHFFNDFTMYIFTVVVWHAVIGLPGSGVRETLNHHQQEPVSGGHEEDIFDPLEEF